MQMSLFADVVTHVTERINTRPRCHLTRFARAGNAPSTSFLSHSHLAPTTSWLATIKIASLLPAIVLSTDNFIASQNVGGELI